MYVGKGSDIIAERPEYVVWVDWDVSTDLNKTKCFDSVTL